MHYKNTLISIFLGSVLTATSCGKGTQPDSSSRHDVDNSSEEGLKDWNTSMAKISSLAAAIINYDGQTASDRQLTTYDDEPGVAKETAQQRHHYLMKIIAQKTIAAFRAINISLNNKGNESGRKALTNLLKQVLEETVQVENHRKALDTCNQELETIKKEKEKSLTGLREDEESKKKIQAFFYPLKVAFALTGDSFKKERMIFDKVREQYINTQKGFFRNSTRQEISFYQEICRSPLVNTIVGVALLRNDLKQYMEKLNQGEERVAQVATAFLQGIMALLEQGYDPENPEKLRLKNYF